MYNFSFLTFLTFRHSNIKVNGVYAGFDPTFGSLHIGNLIPIFGLIICSLNDIQPYALVKLFSLFLIPHYSYFNYKIGSATTLIGDPTGRTSAKSMLTRSEIADNALSISSQIEKIYSNALVLCKHKHFPLKIVDNLTWFKDISLINFLTSIGRQTKVKSMLSRNWYNTFFPHSKLC